MKWINGQLWCMGGAVTVALIMTAYSYMHPTSHGFRMMLIVSSGLIGTLLGYKTGIPSLIWLIYSYLTPYLFGILNIEPFIAHDVPLSAGAAFYALYSVPPGLVGAAMGMTALFIHKKWKTNGQQSVPAYGAQSAPSAEP